MFMYLFLFFRPYLYILQFGYVLLSTSAWQNEVIRPCKHDKGHRLKCLKSITTVDIQIKLNELNNTFLMIFNLKKYLFSWFINTYFSVVWDNVRI